MFADWVFNMRCFGDKQVKTRFVNEVMAFFEGGGVSTTQIRRDYKFWRERGSLIKKQR
jgi:hypothetical protein